MATKQEVVDYVMTTPYNTNPAILKQKLDELDEYDLVINTYGWVQGEFQPSQDYEPIPAQKIEELFNKLHEGKYVKVLYRSHWYSKDDYWKQTSFGCYEAVMSIGGSISKHEQSSSSFEGVVAWPFLDEGDFYGFESARVRIGRRIDDGILQEPYVSILGERKMF